MIASFAAAVVLSSSQSGAVELFRKFTPGTTLTYKVRSSLQTEMKAPPFDDFMVEDVDLNYDSTLQVKKMKADGFVDAVYLRPVMSIIEGETADSPPVETKMKMNMNLGLVLSPINEITDFKDLNKKPAGAKGGAKWLRGLTTSARSAVQMSLPFVQEIQQMALFIGDLNSSVDMQPKLPYEEVKVGATWKRTVSRAPQKLAGAKDGKMEVQRIDMVYTYRGLIEWNGKKVHHITSTAKSDSDAAKFINQVMGTSPSQSGFEQFPLKIEASLDYWLDEKTLHTLEAKGNSTASWKLVVANADRTTIESRMKGKISCKLASIK